MAVSAIPARPQGDNDRACLGPTEILQLAILGGAARGAVDIDDLIATTQLLGGSFWQPTTEVIVACLEALEARALLAIEIPPDAASAARVRVSVKGFDYLAVLMRREMRDVPEPLFHCLLGIKIALLDLLSPNDRQRQIEAFIRRLENMIGALREDTDDRRPERAALSNVIDFEENRLRSEIGWLKDRRTENVTLFAVRP